MSTDIEDTSSFGRHEIRVRVEGLLHEGLMLIYFQQVVLKRKLGEKPEFSKETSKGSALCSRPRQQWGARAWGCICLRVVSKPSRDEHPGAQP